MGRPDLVRDLYDASYRRLVGQLTGVTGSLREAEDVVQDAFLRALDARGLDRVDDPEAWLRTLAAREAGSRWRVVRRRAGLLAPVPDDPEPDTDDPDEREAYAALLAALRGLPAPQREALALHDLADLSVNEVAHTLGAPLGSTRTRLERARAAVPAPLGLVAVVAARETDPPAFTDLADRARARTSGVRRRRVLLAGAAAVVVAGLGALVVLDPGTTPAPSGRGPDRAAPIIHGGQLDGYAGTPDGTVLTLWQRCGETASGARSSCAAAFQVTGPHGTHDGLVTLDHPRVVAGAKSFVLITDADPGRGTVVHADGVTQQLQLVDSVSLREGVVAVPGGKGNLVADPEQASVAAVPLPPRTHSLTGLVVGDDGTLWAEFDRGPGRVFLGHYAGGRWSLHRLQASATATASPVVAVDGAHVAAMAKRAGSTATGEGDLSVTGDAGATWRVVPASLLPVGPPGVDAWGAAGGTLYLGTAEDSRLFRSADEGWTTFSPVSELGPGFGQISPVGGDVLLEQVTARATRLLLLTREGRLDVVPLPQSG